MDYIVITRVEKDKGLYACAYLDQGLNVVSASACSEANLVSEVVRRRGSCKPLNFSIKDGRVKATQGSFTRLNEVPGFSFVVLAQYVAVTGVELGYRVLETTPESKFKIARLQKSEVYSIYRQKCRVGKAPGELNNAIFQNLIFNESEHGAVIKVFNVDEGFPVLTLGCAQKKRKADEGVYKSNRRATIDELKFTAAQLRELKACTKAGVDNKFIANPEFSPKQMHILWTSKKNGCLSYYFAYPKYSEDVMSFYALRLNSKEIAQACLPVLKRPTLGLDEVELFYTALAEGVDLSDVINTGKNKSDLEVQKIRRRARFWDSFTQQEDVDKGFDLGVSALMELKGLNI